MEVVDFIKSSIFFQSFENSEMLKVEKYFEVKHYRKDDIVLSENCADGNIFILLSGRVVKLLNLPGTIGRKNSEFLEGDFFGELSLFGLKTPFDTYSAAEDSSAFLISRDRMMDMVENDSDVAVKIISKFIGQTIFQLRRSSKFFADVVQWGENASRRVITDELTGIYNRAFLDDALESFFTISKSNNKPLSFFMIDMDNFREINKILGRDEANRIIVALVGIINSVTSKHGIVARYGGDEFSVLLPETDLARAVEIAAKVCADVESYDTSAIFKDKKFPFTISIGISSFPDTATDLSEFREKADASLYKAKESGKNRYAYVE